MADFKSSHSQVVTNRALEITLGSTFEGTKIALLEESKLSLQGVGRNYVQLYEFYWLRKLFKDYNVPSLRSFCRTSNAFGTRVFSPKLGKRVTVTIPRFTPKDVFFDFFMELAYSPLTYVDYIEVDSFEVKPVIYRELPLMDFSKRFLTGNAVRFKVYQGGDKLFEVLFGILTRSSQFPDKFPNKKSNVRVSRSRNLHSFLYAKFSKLSWKRAYERVFGAEAELELVYLKKEKTGDNCFWLPGFSVVSNEVHFTGYYFFCLSSYEVTSDLGVLPCCWSRYWRTPFQSQVFYKFAKEVGWFDSKGCKPECPR